MVPRAIVSVLTQTYRDWELIVINDGGTPGPLNMILSKVEPALYERIKVVHNSESVGRPRALNQALRRASGDYVVVHDDDDTWEAGFLEEMVACLQASTARSVRGVVCHSRYVTERVDNSGTIHPVDKVPFNSDLEQVTLWDMAAKNLFPPISFLYDRSVHDEISTYDETLPVLEDWEFNLRFLRRFDILVNTAVLANYHHRPLGGHPIYASTVVDGVRDHNQVTAHIRNRYLRADLDNGEVGLGVMLNLARSYRESGQPRSLSAIENPPLQLDGSFRGEAG